MIRFVAGLMAVALVGCGSRNGSMQDAAQGGAQAFAAATQTRVPAATVDNPFGTDAAAPTSDSSTTGPAPLDKPTTSVSAADPSMATDPVTATDEPTSSRLPHSIGAERSCSDGKRTCGDMTSCEDAMYHLNQCGMTRLDRDHDGTPCETICG